ncbi:hypothetical protein [Paenibacillus rigui]|uniref:hypothetical protein n=1 Tax=Paenibacillus rigui TaxID=554312 RepID=UPI0011808CDC|nr:hypothetical protein [Paenibacillus rigui]
MELGRFEVGRSDPQSLPLDHAATCEYEHCLQPIYYSEPCWNLDGEKFCSAVCVAKHFGANKITAGQE